jgi:periplasmic protein TonB
MQVAQPFASDRTAPAVLTIALHIVLIFGFAAGLGVIPKLSIPTDITVVDVPTQPKSTREENPPMNNNSFTHLEDVPVPREPKFVVEDKEVETVGEPLVVDVGPTTVAEPQVTAPHLLRSFDPPYPNASIRAEEQGVVQVRVTISRRGEVGEARIEKSSGYPRLDDAALKAVRQWAFAPAMRGDQAMAGSTVIAVRFRLKS